MNWLDIVLLLILIVSVVTSFRKGFSREVIGLVAVIAALLAGSWFYGTAGSFLAPYLSSRALANLLGFLLVFGIVMLAGAAVSAVLGRFLKVTGLSIFDHILGAGFGVVRGLVVAVAMILALMAFTPGEQAPSSVVHSRLAPYVADAARVASSMAPRELKDGFRKSYGEAKDAWEKALEKGIRTVPGAEKRKNEREI
jgi:membrane protein required for colicin V production